MIFRQGFNMAAHLAAGVAFGALAFVALTGMKGCCRRATGRDAVDERTTPKQSSEDSR